MNERMYQGYIQLFEAAWSGNLDMVQKLTLGHWGKALLPEDQNCDAWKDATALESPLQIAVQDSNKFSPFSIAVLRGHIELARAIVGIAGLQYAKHTGDKRIRYKLMLHADEDLSNDDDSDYSAGLHDGALPMTTEVIDDQLTVDDLGGLCEAVKSDVSPASMMKWQCHAHRISLACKDVEAFSNSNVTLMDFAVDKNDLALFRILLELDMEQQKLAADDSDESHRYIFPGSLFQRAIDQGRTHMLAEAIKTTGVGFPLQSMIKTQGLEVQSKPKYYQGLSVAGKKRKDWARAPGTFERKSCGTTRPLLLAAYGGSVDSLDWFLSDAPLRLYREWAEANKDDKAIQALQQAKNGFDGSVQRWLNAKSMLVNLGWR